MRPMRRFEGGTINLSVSRSGYKQNQRCAICVFGSMALSLALSACSVGPDYVRPDLPLPAAFKEGEREWVALPNAAPAVPTNPAQWWQVFADPTLNALEARLIIDNQNLKATEAAWRSARAVLDATRASYFPTLTGNASKTRSGGPLVSSPAAQASGGGAGTQYALTAALNWEIDLWGGVRRSSEAAGARLDSAAASLAAARLSAQALLAQTYAQLRAVETQVNQLTLTVAGDQRFLQLTKNRLEAGVASQLDVSQAETQLASAQSQLFDATNQRAQLEHALAVLVGQLPANFDLPAGELPANLPAPPQLIPSTVLLQRADIAAAERQMAAANAQIGVAVAAWFPSLTLGGAAGYKNPALAGLVDAPNRYWSFGPAAALALFDGGARLAAKAQANAAYDQAVANWRQSVLVAFQEVEDNLAATRLLEQEAEAQGRALAAAQKSREIAENQYQAGIGSALTVITAQAAEQNAIVAMSLLTSRRWQAMIQLYKNTGGDWQALVSDVTGR